MGQQFKVGDRVRLVAADTGDRNCGFHNGALGTVADGRVGSAAVKFDGRAAWRWMFASQLTLIDEPPTAESLLLALGAASRELEDAIAAERDAHTAVEAAATRRARASEAHAEALKAVREAAWARAA